MFHLEADGMTWDVQLSKCCHGNQDPLTLSLLCSLPLPAVDPSGDDVMQHRIYSSLTMHYRHNYAKWTPSHICWVIHLGSNFLPFSGTPLLISNSFHSGLQIVLLQKLI